MEWRYVTVAREREKPSFHAPAKFIIATSPGKCIVMAMGMAQRTA